MSPDSTPTTHVTVFFCVFAPWHLRARIAWHMAAFALGLLLPIRRDRDHHTGRRSWRMNRGSRLVINLLPDSPT